MQPTLTLLTGATGFLGQYLLRDMLMRDIPVLGDWFDRLAGRRPASVGE